MDLRNWDGYTRKPVKLEDVSSEIRVSDHPNISELTQMDSVDLWDLLCEPEHPCAKSFCGKYPVEDQVFIYVSDSGAHFLVNTEGYDYMRYVALVVY